MESYNTSYYIGVHGLSPYQLGLVRGRALADAGPTIMKHTTK